MKRYFRKVHAEAVRRAHAAIDSAPDGAVIVVDDDPKRTLDQNAAQWPILEAFSRNLPWPVNGQMVRLQADEWKDILTAAFKKETRPRLAMGLDGGMVMLGQRTSNFGKKQFSEWLDFLHCVAAERGVELGVQRSGADHIPCHGCGNGVDEIENGN